MNALAVLHALRLQGMATTQRVAERAEMSLAEVDEHLLDYEAYGWVRRTHFAGSGGWSLTDAGRLHNERLLAEQLAAADGEAVVGRAFRSFLELNAQFLTSITQWQLGDHADGLLDDLAAIVRSVYPVIGLVEPVLPRFVSYRPRLSLASSMALVGRSEWVDGLEVDSLHRVWFEVHEDFLATLGRSR
jgi:hypothetical protein